MRAAPPSWGRHPQTFTEAALRQARFAALSRRLSPCVKHDRFQGILARLLQINAFSAQPIIRILGEVGMSQTAEIRSIVTVLLVSCVAGSLTWCTPASAQDMQAYCAKIGNDDRVKPVADALLPNARRMFDVPADMAASHVKATTSVRCMNGAVWLCNSGANLICGKADVSRNSPGADRFCKENPELDRRAHERDRPCHRLRLEMRGPASAHHRTDRGDRWSWFHGGELEAAGMKPRPRHPPLTASAPHRSHRQPKQENACTLLPHCFSPS